MRLSIALAALSLLGCEGSVTAIDACCVPGTFTAAGAWTNETTGEAHTKKFVAPADASSWYFALDFCHGSTVDEVRLQIDPDPGVLLPETPPRIEFQRIAAQGDSTEILDAAYDDLSAPSYAALHDLAVAPDEIVDRARSYYALVFNAPSAADPGASAVFVVGPPRATISCSVQDDDL